MEFFEGFMKVEEILLSLVLKSPECLLETFTEWISNWLFFWLFLIFYFFDHPSLTCDLGSHVAERIHFSFCVLVFSPVSLFSRGG